MAVTAYIDDSGSDPTARLYVLGGVALPAAWWTNSFIEAWQGVLDSDPSIAYFKASEVWDYKKGPFRDFTSSQREKKVDTLSEVLCELHPLAISCSVSWEIFEEFKGHYQLPALCRDPYFFLFYALISLIIRISQRHANPTPVDFIFDDQNEVWDRVKSWYPQFKKWLPTEMVSYLGEDPQRDNDKTCLPLQAADMFAWYERRSELSSLQRRWHQDIQQRLSRYHTSAEFDEKGLHQMAADLGICR